MINKKSKKPDMTVIAGCLKGLTSFLVHFTQTVEEGSRYAKDIYGFARRAIDPQVQLSRYEVPRGIIFSYLHSFSCCPLVFCESRCRMSGIN
ncbi:hypothetical protein QZH41_002352 [Actinostola sp. cb2023]|nr:hypothetical protein QZH41_002352 [Actinostola sp. cb2023]